MSGHYQPRRLPQHEQLSLRGLAHRLTWWGERTADPLVLLHGWMDSGDTWQFLVDELPRDWPCVALDWRGFGGSEWPADGYWFPDYFADLDALLDRLVPGPARIVGHSMGANIAAIYAGVRPERLRWLANLEGFGLPRTRPEQAPARYAQWLDELKQTPRASEYRSVEELARTLRNRNPRLEAARAHFIARALTRPSADGRVEVTADPRHKRVSPTLYRREEVEACWRAVRIPVLLLLGARSELRARLGTDAADDYFRTMFADLELATLPGLGHMLHQEDPAAVAAHIVRFAQRQASR